MDGRDSVREKPGSSEHQVVRCVGSRDGRAVGTDGDHIMEAQVSQRGPDPI